MSRVTNIVIHCECGDAQVAIDAINADLSAFRGWDHTDILKEVNHAAGGSKCLEVDLFAGAANHTPTDLICGAIARAPWERLHIDKSTVLILITEEERPTQIYTLADLA